MTWAIESIARGPEGAIKIVVMFDHRPDASDEASARVEASGMYRRFYRTWCASTPSHRTIEIGRTS